MPLGSQSLPPPPVSCRKMSKFTTLLALLSVVPSLAFAQSPVYGQCGGIGWCKSSHVLITSIEYSHASPAGATTCVSGSVCTKLNDYYSQCLYVDLFIMWIRQTLTRYVFAGPARRALLLRQLPPIPPLLAVVALHLRVPPPQSPLLLATPS